jgi:hypothetical protein
MAYRMEAVESASLSLVNRGTKRSRRCIRLCRTLENPNCLPMLCRDHCVCLARARGARNRFDAVWEGIAEASGAGQPFSDGRIALPNDGNIALHEKFGFNK